MKRAHTVKFNDPFGLARANERKVGSRTVFREKSDGKRNAKKKKRRREEKGREDARLIYASTKKKRVYG